LTDEWSVQKERKEQDIKRQCDDGCFQSPDP
jgi:hypothetical protein